MVTLTVVKLLPQFVKGIDVMIKVKDKFNIDEILSDTELGKQEQDRLLQSNEFLSPRAMVDVVQCERCTIEVRRIHATKWLRTHERLENPTEKDYYILYDTIRDYVNEYMNHEENRLMYGVV